MIRIAIYFVLLISFGQGGFAGASFDSKETLRSDHYVFQTKYGSKTVIVTSKETSAVVREYHTVEPIISLIGVNDQLFQLRQIRGDVDHMVDVWVSLETLQIVRAAHETASRTATKAARRIITNGVDRILNRQNELNRSRDQYCACPQIVMGLGDRFLTR